MGERVNTIVVQIVGSDIEQFRTVKVMLLFFLGHIHLDKLPYFHALLDRQCLASSPAWLPKIGFQVCYVVVGDDVKIFLIEEISVESSQVVVDNILPYFLVLCLAIIHLDIV